MRTRLHEIAIGIALLLTASPAPQNVRPKWIPPLRSLVLTHAFNPPAHPWLTGHRGIDLRAEVDTAVRSVGAGRVSFASDLAGRGVVVVDHGGVRTTYEPVRATVRRGELVSAGQQLGLIAPGVGHCGTGKCLHLGLRRGREYLDPMLLLRGNRAVLVPP